MRAIMGRLVTCLLSALLLVPASARAAEDDLPIGSDPPRFVPTAVVDAYCAHHDTSPGQGGSATLMSTADRHGDFAVNLAAIGGRLEHAKLTGAIVLQVGTSIDATFAGTRGNPEVWKHVQLANVGWKSGDLHFEAGVMPSLIGRESFVSTDNWSYTRALIADSTPYYVAGARVGYRITPTLRAHVTVFNGWEIFADKNSGKSGQVHLGWHPTDKLSIDSSTLVGKEQIPIAGKADSYRVFEDLVAAYKLHARVELALEVWGGSERGYEVENPLEGDDKNASILKNPVFYGGALWARWRFGDTVYLAGRAEALVDEAGILTGNGARRAWEPLNGEPYIGQRLAAGTLTFGWQPHKSLLVRVEGSHRIADHPYFSGAKTDYTATPAEKGVTRTFSTDARTSSTAFVASAAFAF
jgi:hypothetical protein